MTATLIGATGLIGKHLLNVLLNDPFYDTVRILIRRPLDFKHEKLEKKIVDFSDGDSLLVAIDNSNVIFCSIGTTQKKVQGDKTEYRKIDHDIAIDLARFAKMTGCEKFIIVSSVGANKNSNNFYLKLKGEIEEDLKATGLKALHIMRPSMLLGDRKEFRFGELVGRIFMPVFSSLLPARYKPIKARTVAKKMVEVSKIDKEGVFVYEGIDLF